MGRVVSCGTSSGLCSLDDATMRYVMGFLTHRDGVGVKSVFFSHTTRFAFGFVMVNEAYVVQ
jgi:hypothetical protein